MSALKNALAEKEKELLRSTETNLDRNCEILRNEANATDRAL